MKVYRPPAPRRTSRGRVTAFLPAPCARADGWTPARQAIFLAELKLSGSVSMAARKAGMARETVYRLRRRKGAESFADAWDAALGRSQPARKVTGDELVRRALDGLLKPVIHAGRHVGTSEKPDNSALLALIRQTGRHR